MNGGKSKYNESNECYGHKLGMLFSIVDMSDSRYYIRVYLKLDSVVMNLRSGQQLSGGYQWPQPLGRLGLPRPGCIYRQCLRSGLGSYVQQ